MKRLIATVLVVGALGVTLAACGDTRSNKELDGVATWPAGGPASGAWNPGYARTDHYGGGGAGYAGATSETVTTTTRTYQPGYSAYPPATYPPPGYR